MTFPDGRTPPPRKRMAELTTAVLHDLIEADRNLAALIENRADIYGDKTFLILGGQETSFAEMDTLANRAAHGLAALGVQHGDRVALMMRTSVEWLALWFGALKLGAVMVPINTAYRGNGLAHILNDSGSRVAVADSDFVERFDALGDELTSMTQLISRPVDADGAAGRRTVADLLDAARTRPPTLELTARDPAAILYTSGTTGPAKGCLLPHGQYLASAHQMNANCGYDSTSVLYSCLPLFHINAQNYSVLSALTAGASLALDEKFTASGFFDRLTAVGATAFNIIGGIPLMLWSQPERAIERQHSAQVAFGVPVPLDLWEPWEKRFGVRIVYAYGMTENGLPTLFPFDQTPADPRLRGSGGRATPSAEVAIVDAQDQFVAPGVVGEVVTRPRIPWTMMLEYYGNPQATVTAWKNGWFHTGDLGYLNEDGYFFYVDRAKDALRRRGEMVSSWDVESVVSSFPSVAQCAVYGVPSEVGEDEIMVAVVLVDGVSLDHQGLLAHCRLRMAAFQLPRFIRVLAALPRTQTDRVEKYKLRDQGVTSDTWDSAAAN
jgi:crotonobetaine/carnitine-CoA ligase